MRLSLKKQVLCVCAACAILVGLEANAQVAFPGYDAICKPGGERVAQRTHAEFWQSIMDLHPIAVPVSSMLSTAPPTGTNCGRVVSAPSVRREFAQLVTDCGYPKAVLISLTMSDEAFEKTPTSLCPTSLGKQEPTCTQIAAGRKTLSGRLGGTPPGAGVQPGYGQYFIRFSGAVTSVSFDSSAGAGQIRKAWEDTAISVSCGPAIPEPASPDIPDWLLIGKNSSAVVYDLERPDYLSNRKDAPAAEIGLSFDREDRVVVERDEDGNSTREEYNDVVDVNLAVGYQLRGIGGDNAGPLGIYSSLAYKSNFDPTKETDDLAFGVRKILNNEFLNIPELELAWITDIEERESAQWLVTGRYWPLPQTVENVTNSLTRGLVDSDLILLADYNHVIDPGDKQALASVGETFRLGYELNLLLDPFRSSQSPFRPSLKGSYQYRDTIGQGAGNADLVSLELAFLDLKESRTNLKLVYNRGEQISSLEEVEEYKLVLTLK